MPMLFIPCSVRFSPAPALIATSLLFSILSLGMTVPQMFAQQLCTCLPVGRGRNSFCQGLLVGPEEMTWCPALAAPRSWAVALSLVPICLGSDEENFPQNILPQEKPLWEQLPQLLLPLQMWVHFPLLGKEWELFQGHQIPVGARETELGPWRPSWDQYYVDLAACRVQMMKNQLGTNPVSYPWRSCPLLLDTSSIKSRANIWVRKKMEWELCPLSSTLWFVWTCLANTGFGSPGERTGVGFSMCCQRPSGASHPVPMGSGSWEPPSTLFQW